MCYLRAAGSLLGINGSLLAHGSEDDNILGGSSQPADQGRRAHGIELTGVLLLDLEKLVDLLGDLTAVGHLDVILGLTILRHEGEEAIVGDIELNRV